MANSTFDPAFEKVILNEGRYVNDPQDPGGETYKGVSRNNWSSWRGWQNIDLAKRRPDFPANLEKDIDLQSAVKDFYLNAFWNQIQGDRLADQSVANSIFDFAVNAGVKTSVSLAQMVVGTDPDGVVGDITIKAINDFDPDYFLASFTLAKIARYITIVKKRPTSQKYFYGWTCRALGV
jgi:lysozyme family protein